MRCILVLALLLAGAASAAAAPAPEPANSAGILFHLHPRPWRPPVARLAPASAGLVIDDTGALAAGRSARAARLAPEVQSMPDGSTLALLGGRIRMYTVVRLGADGRLLEDCTTTADAARRLMTTPAPAGAYAEK